MREKDHQQQLLHYVSEHLLLSPFLLQLVFCVDLLSTHQLPDHQSFQETGKVFLPSPWHHILFYLDTELIQPQLSCPYHRVSLKSLVSHSFHLLPSLLWRHQEFVSELHQIPLSYKDQRLTNQHLVRLQMVVD